MRAFLMSSLAGLWSLISDLAIFLRVVEGMNPACATSDLLNTRVQRLQSPPSKRKVWGWPQWGTAQSMAAVNLLCLVCVKGVHRIPTLGGEGRRVIQRSDLWVNGANLPLNFEFNTNTSTAFIRVVDIDGEPWFVAKDVCEALGLSHITMALQNCKNSEVLDYRVPGTRGRPNKLVSEAGLYKLTFRSTKPNARAFTDWVTGTVLPAIRKDGGYIAGEEKVTGHSAMSAHGRGSSNCGQQIHPSLSL